MRVHPKFLHSNATSHKWALGGIGYDLLKILVPKIFESIFYLMTCVLSYSRGWDKQK